MTGPRCHSLKSPTQQPRPRAVGGPQEAGQQLELGAALAEGQTEVAVEEVHGRVVDVEVHAQAAARLAPVARQIAARPSQHGQPREDGVAVGAVP